MEEWIDYIDRYFRGELTGAEKVAFEERCVNDLSFAEAVAFYITARQTVRSALQDQQREQFSELYQELAQRQRPPALLRRLRPYIAAAAACLLIVFGWVYFFSGKSPEQLAENYIQSDLQSLSVTMGGQADSLQQGLAAFNKGDYAEAEKIFGSLTRQPVPDADAFRYLGIVYLVTGRYDRALQQFETLSSYPGLHANPGPFYKAITLMKRSTGNDLLQAKALLQEIIDKKLPGHREATDWIRQF